MEQDLERMSEIYQVLVVRSEYDGFPCLRPCEVEAENVVYK